MKGPFSTIIKGVRGSARTIGGMFRSKYTEIILAVALFIFLDTGVLIINFYTSYQIANDAHAIQLASRMGTLSQSILHELYQVQDDSENPDVDYLATIDALANTYKVFDETLDAFIYGGELIGKDQGQDTLLEDTAYRNTSANLLKEVEGIWMTYRTKLKPIVYAYYSKPERNEVIEASQAAISYARLQSDNLLQLMQSFATAVEGVAQRKAERLRTIQTIGISLAVINFFLILFHFLKRLKHSDALVEKSRKETEDILENVNEGLLLLDQHYIIGSQHSKSLHVLFKEDNLAGRNFIDLLRPLVTEKTLDTVEDYTEILFSPRVNESLISDLNPLKQVEVNLTTDAAAFDIRYFTFQFSRVYEKKGFNTLLVTVKDITEQVQLSERLKAANKKASKEIDMLLEIIHVENTILTDFLQSTVEGLNNVNNILKKPAKGTDSLKNKLETIFRIVHKLKGDSTVLELEFVMEKFHALESAIARLKEKKDMTGEDFLPLVVHLSQLMADFTIIGKLQKKMRASDPPKFKHDPPLPVESSADTQDYSRSGPHWKKQLSILVKRIARDYNKEAVLDMSDFDVTLLSKEQTEPVKDIIVQSLRNSVAHGIETPIMRENVGKSLEGSLKVALKKNGEGLQLTIRDDGQGIDLEKIKARAISTGLATENQLSNWQRSRLLSLIFLQGFTTAQESNVHAGHGVGMDLIKSRLDLLKGQAGIRYQTGRYTEFQYSFKVADSVVQ
jgi:hypothetical protein